MSRVPYLRSAGAAVASIILLLAFVVAPLTAAVLHDASARGPAPDLAPQPAALSNRQAQIRRIEHQTTLIRGLRPLHSVRISFLDNKAFNRFISRYFRQGDSPHDIKISDVEAVFLGLISPSTNLTRILTQGLGHQVVGLYDHRTKKLSIRDTGQALGIDRWTIAHEFTHALQDQHFNLNHVQPDQTHWKMRDSDASLAEHSLIEGDALSVQYAYFVRFYTSAQQVALQKQQEAYTGGHVPRMLEEQFNFPYLVGGQYVSYLLNRGGYGRVNHALRRPPHSTYQVMFPGTRARYYSLSLHGVAGSFRSWKVADDDVNGAYGYEQLVEQYVPASSAHKLASLWRGDRYVLLERHGKYVFYLESRYQDSRAAREAGDIIRSSMASRFHSLHHFGGGTWAGRSGIDSALRIRGSMVYLAYGGSAKLVETLVTSRSH